ncbi:MAG: nitroreductase family deazaflavin-dependent oxidoreductase [Acidimicrobiia bacterium]|jgi:F420H(2)-dependent quinone reductase
MRTGTARRLSRIHVWLYRLTGGMVGRRLVDNDMLLLTTTGRHSGRPHTVPLLYLANGERLVVVASWGGKPDHPHWYLNLAAEPLATVQVRSRRFPVVARTASPEERATWWPRVVAAYDGYAGYEERTDRQIPVVFLDPAGG